VEVVGLCRHLGYVFHGDLNASVLVKEFSNASVVCSWCYERIGRRNRPSMCCDYEINEYAFFSLRHENWKRCVIGNGCEGGIWRL
jgi:hypothetical protein